jgi:hypothetical protein
MDFVFVCKFTARFLWKRRFFFENFGKLAQKPLVIIMALSQSLQQKLLQKLSPQQIQLMKLLQVPTANLEERIKEELEENPALETSEDTHDENFNEEAPAEEFEKEVMMNLKPEE